MKVLQYLTMSRRSDMAKRPLLLLVLTALVPVQAADTTTTTAAETTPAATTTTTGKTTTATATNAAETSTTATVGQTTSSVTGSTTGSTIGTSASGSSTSGSSTSAFSLSGVPTISGYSIPTMVIPWTAGAPFMKSSNFPDGFVFIVVGAILGFLALCVVLWRGAIAWSLRRSVRKAASRPSHYNDAMLKSSKPTQPPITARRTSASQRLSTAPAGRLSKHGRSNSSAKNSPGHAKNPSLFFSPTAGAGSHISPTAALMNSGGNRSSTCLPSGYYAAPGTTAPAQGAKSTAVGSGAAAVLSSLNPLHPSSKGYRPQQDYSPPESPAMAPAHRTSTDHTRRGSVDRTRRSRTGGYERTRTSGSSNRYKPMHGGATDGGRAPSANLENLFDHHGNGTRGY